MRKIAMLTVALVVVSAGTAVATSLVPYAGTTSQQKAGTKKPAIKFNYGLGNITGFTYTATATCKKPGLSQGSTTAPVAGRIANKMKVTNGKFSTPPPSPGGFQAPNTKTVTVSGTIANNTVTGTLNVSYASSSSPVKGGGGLSCSTGTLTFTAAPAAPAKKHKGHK